MERDVKQRDSESHRVSESELARESEKVSTVRLENQRLAGPRPRWIVPVRCLFLSILGDSYDSRRACLIPFSSELLS